MITHSYVITPANINDVTVIEKLVENIEILLCQSYKKPLYIVGDKAYQSKEIYYKLRKYNMMLTYPFRKIKLIKIERRNKYY